MSSPLLRASALVGLLAVASTPCPAQYRDAVRVGAVAPPASASMWTPAGARLGFTSAVARADVQPPDAMLPCRVGPLARRLVNEPVLDAVVGALVGGAMYYVTVGLLASDRGAGFRRGRRNFMLGGAGLGAAHGVYTLVTVPTCTWH